MKSFGSKPWILPPLGPKGRLPKQEPVLIIGTYDKGGACDVDNITGGYQTCPKCQGVMEPTGEKEFWT